MDIKQINKLTKVAYDKTANKYHENFKNEIEQKEYDRLILDSFSQKLKPDSFICDVGCGPSGHIGKYMIDKGHKVTGIDISQKCIDIANEHNPQIEFKVMDMMNTTFEDSTFDAIISFYSVIHTPKKHITSLLAEYSRILKEDGKLLLVVKKGTSEDFIDDDWYEGNKIYFTHFLESEIEHYFTASNFSIDFMDTRKPYDFEFDVDRIYTIGTNKK